MLTHIRMVAEVNDYKTANAMLQDGWQLLQVVVNHGVHYCLGWPHSDRLPYAPA